MPYYHFFWTDEIIAHLAEHEVTRDDFERIIRSAQEKEQSRATNLPAAFGYTEDGRFIIAVYDHLDELTILPVTAYEVPERR